MKKINLSNRYGYNFWLEHTSDDLWILKTTDESNLKYMRQIYNEDNSIFAIDPSGGPFLSLGTEIDNYIIEEILQPGCIFKLSKK